MKEGTHRGAVKAFIGVIALAVAPTMANGQASPEWSKAFDQADRTARLVTDHLSCMARLAELAHNGVVTPADSADALLTCAVLQGRMIGLFVKVDPSWKGVKKLIAFEPEQGRRIAVAVDTGEVIKLLLAQSRAVRTIPEDSVQYLPPVSARVDSTIHVWVIPGAILPTPAITLGGEHHIVIAGDASRVMRVDSQPPRRIVQPTPGTLEWTFETGSDSVPPFSMMLAANMLAKVERTPLTSLVLRTKVAQLIDGTFWIFMPKKP